MKKMSESNPIQTQKKKKGKKFKKKLKNKCWQVHLGSYIRTCITGKASVADEPISPLPFAFLTTNYYAR